MFHKYNPKRVVASWSGDGFAIQFDAFMDNSFIGVEMQDDQVKRHVGGQGDVTAVISCDDGAVFTFSINQGTPTNDALSKQVASSKRNKLPTGTLEVKDLNGTTIATAKNAWIMRRAKIEFGKDLTGREWKFECDSAEITVGGAGDF
jgi:hypothetical protein